MQHIGIFVMQVEQIDLVAQHGAVKAALLHQHIMEGIGIGINRGRAHATRGTLATDDEAFNAQTAQMRNQRRAEKGRSAFFVDHEIAGLRREFLLDSVNILILAAHIAIGGMHARRIRMTRGIDDRDARATRGRKELLCRRHGLPRILTAGPGKFAVHLNNRPIAALIGFFVEVDCEQRGTRADIEIAAIGTIDLDHLVADDVFPAIVLKRIRHGVTPVVGLIKEQAGLQVKAS